MQLSTMFKSLCMPSKVYLVLSVFGILSYFLSNSVFGGITLFVQLMHIVYVLFWTWVLDLICKAGYKWISWVLVLAPFLVVFLTLSIFLNDSFEKERLRSSQGSLMMI